MAALPAPHRVSQLQLQNVNLQAPRPQQRWLQPPQPAGCRGRASMLTLCQCAARGLDLLLLLHQNNKRKKTLSMCPNHSSSAFLYFAVFKLHVLLSPLLRLPIMTYCFRYLSLVCQKAIFQSSSFPSVCCITVLTLMKASQRLAKIKINPTGP